MRFNLPIHSRPMTRRQMLGSSLALGAFMLPGAEAKAAPGRQRAKGVILVLLEGGMSHLESWDPKPNAPAEIRGERLDQLAPDDIATSIVSFHRQVVFHGVEGAFQGPLIHAPGGPRDGSAGWAAPETPYNNYRG